MNDDDASSSPASYIRLVQHLIEKCICYKLNKEECMETLEKHAKIMPVITSTVWKELEKENREFFETYRKDRGGAGGPNQEASTTSHHHPWRVQQSCGSQASSTTTTLQKNPSGEKEQRVVENKENRKSPSHEQEQRVVEKEKRKIPSSASKSSGDDANQNSRSID